MRRPRSAASSACRGPVFWPYPAKNTYDRATAAMPKLLHQRLDEMGLDFTILNPSQGLSRLTSRTMSYAAPSAGHSTTITRISSASSQIA